MTFDFTIYLFSAAPIVEQKWFFIDSSVAVNPADNQYVMDT
jgi:hypothetical protein